MEEAELRTASLDIDSCFVNTEILRYPDLKDVAAVVGGGGDQAPRSLVNGTRQYARQKNYIGRGTVPT